LHGDPHGRAEQTEKDQVQLICDFCARDHHGDAQLHARHFSMSSRAPGARPALDVVAAVGIFGAETVGRRDAHGKSKCAFASTACDIYGLSEVNGSGRRARSLRHTKDGPTIWGRPFHFPEVRGPAHRQRCDRRRAGRILVFTSLYQEAMPVIRYRTRGNLDAGLLPGNINGDAAAWRRSAGRSGRTWLSVRRRQLSFSIAN